MKPVIGITSLVDKKQNSFWIMMEYVNGITQAGGIPVVLPPTSELEDIKQLAQMYDGFLFAGGPDIDPKYWNEEVHPECGLIIPERDSFELPLFKEVIELDKPVFGICRGIQTMNVALGGTLYQDLKSQYSETANHRMEAPYHRGVHKVSILPGTPFAKALGLEELPVNTRHHQAIRDLAPELKEAAISDDGLIEGVYMPEKKFVWGVQWHPEHSLGYNMHSEVFFKAFIDACK